MARQWHDIRPGSCGWTCTCGDSGTGGAAEADDHVVAAWEVDVALAGLGQVSSDEDERV